MFYVQGISFVQNFSISPTPVFINNIRYGSVNNGIMKVTYDAVEGVTGSEVLRLNANASSGFVSNSYSFQMTVEDNIAPAFSVPSEVKCKVGVLNTLPISNITDGNASAKQNITFSLTKFINRNGFCNDINNCKFAKKENGWS